MRHFAGEGTWTVLGLMSGTSLDGLDAARMRFTRGQRGLESWELLDYRQAPFPAALRAEVEALIRGEARDAAAFAALHLGLARAFADFVRAAFADCWPPAELAAFPGQTLWHDPDGAGLSLQLGSPAAFAALTGLPTVGEFRLPDVLAGGQGAPLVPLADALLHRAPAGGEYRALLNLGGIANITLLPPGAGTEGVRAWDTGPGNTLLDALSALATGAPHDTEGRLAAAGRPREDLLAAWLAHPWFRRPPPKSTGRELFGGSFLNDAELRDLLRENSVEDLMATLVELTVEPIVAALDSEPADRLYVAGGGVFNRQLMKRLAERLAPLPLEPFERLGLPAAAREAADFALLALEAAAGRPVALPAVTGARQAMSAGLFAPAAPAVLTDHV